jgi:hypothetical protein
VTDPFTCGHVSEGTVRADRPAVDFERLGRSGRGPNFLVEEAVMASKGFRVTAAAGLAVGVLAVFAPAPAGAVTPDGRTPSAPAAKGGDRHVVSVEWDTSVPADPFDYPPGEVCVFPMHVEFPVNGMRDLITRYSDGSRTEFITGPLRGRYTNLTTGRTIERDLSGDGVLEFRPDGGFLLSVVGGAGIGFHGDDNPAHVYQVNGPRSVVVVDLPVEGAHTRLLQVGPYEDLCRTLR